MNSFFVKALILLAAFAAVSPAQQTASDSAKTRDEKIDRMGGKIDEIHTDTRILREKLVESPLGNRKWGVEVNPLYLLFLGREATLSGTVSNFSWNRSAEVALPVWYSVTRGDDASTIFNLDPQFRYFLGGAQRGFYLSGFTRYQYARYRTVEDIFSGENETRTLNRGGVGFGLGSRIFSRSGFYWGFNLSLGRYIIGDKVGDDELPNRPSLWTKDLIIDAEFLKIGFAF